MEAIKLNQDGLFNLEQPMIKVPFEQLKRQFKTSQKLIEKEMLNLQSKVADPSDTQELLRKLSALKSYLKESRQQEQAVLSRAKTRLEYLDQISSVQTVDDEIFDRWSKTRLNHLLVDYLSRHAFPHTALKLAQDSAIEELVDLDLFAQVQRIEDSLKNRNCVEALQWCTENKSNLKKIKSSLEFNLRLQEYIELVRSREIIMAIQYCKKHLVPWSETHLKEIQQASGLLAFDPSTDCHTYKALFDPHRWRSLTHALKRDIFTLNSLTKQPMLNLTMQAGLTALKTHSCYSKADRNVNCPVCAAGSFGVLAESLPNAHYVNSSLVCRISGRLMDESNPPLVLPNGQVYSTNALKEMHEKEGIVQCPRSGDTYTLSETRKAFIS